VTKDDSLYLVNTDGKTRPLFYVVRAPFNGAVKKLAGPQPRLNLWTTKYSKAKAAHRQAHRMMGSSEAQGAEVAGAVDYYLRAMGERVRDSLRTEGEMKESADQPNRRDERKFQTHLRTAADTAVERDAGVAHQIDGQRVVLVALTEESPPRVFPKDWRDHQDDYEPQDVYTGRRWCKTCGLSHTDSYGACREPALVTGLCESCSKPKAASEPRTRLLDGVTRSMCKRCWNAHHEGNIRAQERMLPEGSIGRVYGDHKSADAGDGPPQPIHAQGVVSDPTGDTATHRVDLGDVPALIADEILSPQERRVLELSTADLLDSEIAAAMGVHRRSVAVYRERATTKLTPRRRVTSWRRSAGQFPPVTCVVRRRSSQTYVRSLLSGRGRDEPHIRNTAREDLCPSCRLIVPRHLMGDGACVDCEYFLSTKGPVVALHRGRDNTELFLTSPVHVEACQD
jgi:DNA-binding CsgD family transcriptional regulator